MIVRIFTHEELYEYLLDPEYTFEKFHDLENRIKYMKEVCPPYSSSDERYVFFCILENEKIVGVLKLRIGKNGSFGYPECKNWMMFLSIDPERQGKGYSKILVHECMKYCNTNNLDLLMSGYTKVGWERIRKRFHEIAEKYSVNLIDDRSGPEFL